MSGIEKNGEWNRGGWSTIKKCRLKFVNTANRRGVGESPGEGELTLIDEIVSRGNIGRRAGEAIHAQREHFEVCGTDCSGIVGHFLQG